MTQDVDRLKALHAALLEKSEVESSSPFIEEMASAIALTDIAISQRRLVSIAQEKLELARQRKANDEALTAITDVLPALVRSWSTPYSEMIPSPTVPYTMPPSTGAIGEAERAVDAAGIFTRGLCACTSRECPRADSLNGGIDGLSYCYACAEALKAELTNIAPIVPSLADATGDSGTQG